MASNMLLTSLALLTTVTLFASADVQFTSPNAGATVAGGKAITINWKESGDKPAISDLLSYSLYLWAGGNEATEQQQVAVLATNQKFSTGNSASGTVPIAAGQSIENAYFLQMICAAQGGTIINYSDRFSISGMTGTFSPTVASAAKAIKDTKGPDTQNDVGDSGGGQPTASSGTVAPYTAQTGPIRYAPMQQKPGTKITAKSASRRYPTSSVAIASTYLPPPSQTQTVTASNTFTTQSTEHTASPAPMPDAMQKFLNRWRD